MLNFKTLFKIKKFLNRYALDRKPLSLEEGRLNMMIMPLPIWKENSQREYFQTRGRQFNGCSQTSQLQKHHSFCSEFKRDNNIPQKILWNN